MISTDAITVTLIDEANACDPVRLLMKEFIRWHFKRHTQDQDLISEYFDAAAFEKELRELPGKYIFPDGALLLAFYNNEPAGCVALRRIDDESCEMKRMFVYEKFHGYGIGKRLAMQVIEQAQKLGFRKMKLDTSIRQKEAQQLYQRMGFQLCQPYYDLPDRLKNWLVFMEMNLAVNS